MDKVSYLEKRKWSRYLFQGYIHTVIEYHNRIIQCIQVNNISLEGFECTVQEKLNTGEKVWIEMNLPAPDKTGFKQIFFPGNVKRVNENGVIKENKSYKIALQFNNSNNIFGSFLKPFLI